MCPKGKRLSPFRGFFCFFSGFCEILVSVVSRGSRRSRGRIRGRVNRSILRLRLRFQRLLREILVSVVSRGSRRSHGRIRGRVNRSILRFRLRFQRLLREISGAKQLNAPAPQTAYHSIQRSCRYHSGLRREKWCIVLQDSGVSPSQHWCASHPG